MTHYEHAPITEAVIEIQFADALSDRDLERVRDRFKAAYPTVQQRLNVEVKLEGTKATPKITPTGFQLNAANGQDAILALQRSFSTIRFAPYENWEQFAKRAQENFETYLKILARPVINRIGARFVNRIDIPTKSIIDHDISEFFSTHVNFGGNIRHLYSFELKARVSEKETGTSVNIRIGTTAPALIDHESFTLDIDAFQTDEIPLKLDELWRSFSVLRQAKNNVFETAITDRSKALFGKKL